MSLYRDPKGRGWYVRFSIGGIKVRRSAQTDRREQAEEFEAKLRADLWRQRKLGERPRYTWGQALARWYEQASGRGKERDRERLAWFSTYLTDTALADIGPSLIEKLRAVRCAETGPATANRYLALLRMILRKAHREWDWLDRVPTVPMYRLERSEPRFLTRAQFAKLKRELPEHLAALAEFSVETGLRMRNATGLTWAQVDLKRQWLVIPASSAKAGETIGIPLSARALALLKASRGHPTHAFTFRGKPIDDANGAAFQKAAARAGVPWLRWHDLRHTWASWAVQRGVPLHAVQRLGGWRSLAMVQRYAHLSDESLRAFVRRKKGRG